MGVLCAACDGIGSGEGRGRRSGRAAYPVPGEEGQRVTAEVLNASGRAGHARSGTRRLRQAGIDVVYYGNAPAALGNLDTTRIVVRRGDRGQGERVRRALGGGTVLVELDSTRLLDVSVFLGADFRPPREFDP